MSPLLSITVSKFKVLHMVWVTETHPMMSKVCIRQLCKWEGGWGDSFPLWPRFTSKQKTHSEQHHFTWHLAADSVHRLHWKEMERMKTELKIEVENILQWKFLGFQLQHAGKRTAYLNESALSLLLSQSKKEELYCFDCNQCNLGVHSSMKLHIRWKIKHCIPQMLPHHV